MIKIKALEKNEFKDILINPDHVVAVFPIFMPGEIVGGPAKEKALVTLSTGQQLIINTTIDDFFIGLNDANNESTV